MPRHYHVFAGLHGCLPLEAYTVKTLAEARVLAAEIKRDFNSPAEEHGDDNVPECYRKMSGSVYRDGIASNGTFYVEVAQCSDDCDLDPIGDGDNND